MCNTLEIILTFEELQTEYKIFLDQLYSIHYLLAYLVKHTNQYLTEYTKLNNSDKEFADNIELYLLYFEKFHESVDYITELADSLDFDKLKVPEIKNLMNISDYLVLPENYDIDVIIDMNKKS